MPEHRSPLATDASGAHTPVAIELPAGWLTPEGFEALFSARGIHQHLGGGGIAVVRFPRNAALPAGIGLVLLSLLNQLACVGAGTVRLEFESTDLFGYLDRNGFLKLLDPRIETTPARPAVSSADVHRGMSDRLVEISAIVPGTSGDEKQALVGDLVDKLIHFYPANERAKRLRSGVFTALAELVDNVFNHSFTPIPGYAILQAYKGARPAVQIAVSDSGLGIPRSIRQALTERVSGKSDVDLIVQAFKEGLSRHGTTSGRGCGLPRCAALAAEYGSWLRVRTPEANVTLYPARAAGSPHEAHVVLPQGRLDGTHICLEFPVT